jgi:hypothetical protein
MRYSGELSRCAVLAILMCRQYTPITVRHMPRTSSRTQIYKSTLTSEFIAGMQFFVAFATVKNRSAGAFSPHFAALDHLFLVRAHLHSICFEF